MIRSVVATPFFLENQRRLSFFLCRTRSAPGLIIVCEISAEFQVRSRLAGFEDFGRPSKRLREISNREGKRMKKLICVAIATLLASVIVTIPSARVEAGAGKAGRQNKRTNRGQIKAQLIREFDKDGDGKLTGPERKAAKQALRQLRQSKGDNGQTRRIRSGKGRLIQPYGARHRGATRR